MQEKMGGVDHIKTSMLNLVDLAGSERQKDTGAVGARLRVGLTLTWLALLIYLFLKIFDFL